MRTIEWNDERKSVLLIDQTKLPEYVVIECRTLDELIHAIKNLKVRGAPALGVAGAFGIALAACEGKDLKKSAELLKKTRPTAVNLFYGINRALNAAREGGKEKVIEEAERMAEEDVRINKSLGDHGAELLRDGDTVLTHCNAGRMACVDWGTALGIVRSAVEKGKKIKVIACETRPLNQGGRITTWELMEDGIPVTLITDSTAGWMMRSGKVDCVIVGADRIVKDAVFNKIGTYTHAVLAKENKIPFYVAAPLSTFDLDHEEKDITIEERDSNELKFLGKIKIAPENVDVYNPAFDATPLELVSAIITEKGILYPPFFDDV
ncbi:MAG: S-methyl-5-thioribose-1-phosphate isomerase [Candidatus Syntropharchaeia archaeon]